MDVGPPRPRPHRDLPPLVLDRREAVGPAPAEDVGEARRRIGRRRGGEQFPPLLAQLEADLEAGQRGPLRGGEAVLELGPRRLEELAPGGDPGEEAAHRDGRARGARGRPLLEPLAALDDDARAGVAAARPRHQFDPRHGADRGQRLAAEAERPHGVQVGAVLDLARRVAGEGQRGVLGRHPRAVVGDGDEVDPPRLEVDLDPPRPRVEGVVEQLADDRRRPLDDLARGDPVGEGGRQDVNPAHGTPPRNEVILDRPSSQPRLRRATFRAGKPNRSLS